MVLTSKFRLLIFTLSLSVTFMAYGESVKLLPCLGKEEARLYKKKDKGTLYKLNQNIINVLVDSPDLIIAPNYVHLICSPKYSASKQVLMYGVLYREKIFTFSKKRSHQIEYFISQLPKLFFSYLTDIQAEMPKANCLEKEIPEIKYFLDRYKYLQTELSEQELFSQEGKKIRKIFTSLASYAKLYKRCKKD